MANDFYTQEEDQGEQYALMEEEFHEWQVLNDVVALVASKGLPSVLSSILEMMEDR